jgi:Holliday junction DNA helicase RuvA
MMSASQIELFVYTHVREDALELFGFETLEEKMLFAQLLQVSGVGPRMALAVLHAPAQHIIQAIQQADVTFFTAIPRVGKKLAQKIIVELANKLGTLQELNLAPPPSEHQDAIAALEALGFITADAQRAVRVVYIEGLPTGQLVKQALQVLQHARQA